MEPSTQQPQPQNTNEPPIPESPMPGTSITPQTPEAPETPVVPPSPSTPVPPAPQEKTSSRKPLLLVLLILLLLVAAGAVYWFVLKGDSSDANNSNSSSQSDETPAVGEFDPAVKFEQYAAEIKAANAELSDFKSYSGSEEAPNGSVVLYGEKIAHYVGLTSPNNWSGTIGRDTSLSSDSETDFSTQLYDDLISKLKTDGFSDYIFDKQPQYENPTTSLRNNDIVCDVSRTSNDRIFYACVRLSELDAQADFVKPFYDSYMQEFSDANSDGCLLIQMNKSDVEEAKDFSDYEVARGGVGCVGTLGGGAANFYRKKGGEWNFSHGGQDAPMCSEFDNADQQKAFADASCYADEDEGFEVVTVKEHYGL